MTSSDVKAIVDAEIRAGWNAEDPRANPHGVEIARCLLAHPESRTYADSFNGNAPVQMWLVLEEDPDAHAGLEIVYVESEGMFGLAIGKTFIGCYGNFRETLAGM